MSPNSNGFYKSKLFKFINRQYQKISEKSLIVLRRLKIALSWGLQIVLYPVNMLLKRGQKSENSISGKNQAGQTAESLSYSEKEAQKISPQNQQEFTGTAEQTSSLLEFKERLSTQVTREETTTNKQEGKKETGKGDIDYQGLEQISQEIREKLDSYIEKDKEEDRQDLLEEKVVKIEEIDIKTDNWIEKVNEEAPDRLDWEEAETIEEINWVKKEPQKVELNPEKKADSTQENWLEEISGQVTEFNQLEEVTAEAKEESNPIFDNLEEITKQTVELDSLEEITQKSQEFELEKPEEKVSQFNELDEIVKQKTESERVEQVEAKGETVSQFTRSETTEKETENINDLQNQSKEEIPNLNNLAIVHTNQPKKLIPTIKEYISGLLLGVLEKVTNKENLENTLEKTQIIFRNSVDYLLDKFGEYSGRIKTNLENLEITNININRSLNLGKEAQETNLELKSYLLSGIQNYLKDTDIAYKELNLDPSQEKENKRKVSPDWLETKATTVGYVKQPLEVILGLLDRILFWIEEVLADLWFWIREKIAKIRNK